MFIESKELIFDYHIHNESGDIESSHRALDGIDLSVNKGDFIAILGHNGSGKSTFAKQLNALLLPSEGRLYVSGFETSQEEHLWDIRKNAGMVFQNPDNQIIGTIVEEDVAFGPENLGLEPGKIRFLVDQSLSTVEMTDYASHSPNKLSGGQKQRVAIAGVLAMKPQCIILDEPTAMLDPLGRKEVLDTIHQLNQEENITIILITHNMEEAVLADHVYVMEDGKIHLQGRPKEVFSRVTEMKAIGLDVPPMTDLAYRLRKKGYDLPQDILTEKEMVTALCQLKSKN